MAARANRSYKKGGWGMSTVETNDSVTQGQSGFDKNQMVHAEISELEDRADDLRQHFKEAYKQFEEARMSGRDGWETSGKAIAAKAACDELKTQLLKIEAQIALLRDQITGFDFDAVRMNKISSVRRKAEKLISDKQTFLLNCHEASVSVSQILEEIADKLHSIQICTSWIRREMRESGIKRAEISEIPFNDWTLKHVASQLLSDKQNPPTLGTISLLRYLQEYFVSADAMELGEQLKSHLAEE
jgi:hypothetical protein